MTLKDQRYREGNHRNLAETLSSNPRAIVIFIHEVERDHLYSYSSLASSGLMKPSLVSVPGSLLLPVN